GGYCLHPRDIGYNGASETRPGEPSKPSCHGGKATALVRALAQRSMPVRHAALLCTRTEDGVIHAALQGWELGLASPFLRGRFLYLARRARANLVFGWSDVSSIGARKGAFASAP